MTLSQTLSTAVRERGQLLHARQQLVQARAHQRECQRGLLLPAMQQCINIPTQSPERAARSDAVH